MSDKPKTAKDVARALFEAINLDTIHVGDGPARALSNSEMKVYKSKLQEAVVEELEKRINDNGDKP